MLVEGIKFCVKFGYGWNGDFDVDTLQWLRKNDLLSVARELITKQISVESLKKCLNDDCTQQGIDDLIKSMYLQQERENIVNDISLGLK